MNPVKPENIGIIILAAGRSLRFGADKRKAMLADGNSLLDSTLAKVPESFQKKILVLKAEDEDLADLYKSRWQICLANNPDAGMANSLSSAIKAASGWEAAVIGLGDMPYINQATYGAVQKALTQHEIVIPGLGGKRGNPVGFRQHFFNEILQLEGDQGAKSLLQKYSDQCFVLETQDEGIIRDIDTPDKLT